MDEPEPSNGDSAGGEERPAAESSALTGLSSAEIAAESVRFEEARRSAPLERVGRSLLGTALLISGATLISRALGLTRDVAMASMFGFSREMDAFFLAFTIPNLFRKLFGEGALSSATIPVLTRYKLANDPEATRRLLGTLSTLLVFGLGGITGIALGVAWLVPPQWFGDGVTYVLFRNYLSVLLPYVIFICLAALQTGALNCNGRFGLPALMPALANLIWIGALLLIWFGGYSDDPSQAVLIMAVGVTVSGVAQWALQLPALAKLKLLAGPKLALKEPGVRQTLRAMAPMLFALAVFQINTFLDQILAEFLVEGHGAVSSYAFASRLFQFPLGLVAVALSTALFPLMSRFAEQGEYAKLTAGLLNSMRLLVFISLPAAVGLAVLAYPITELLFGGQASIEMLERSALVVTLLCISLPVVSVISMLTKAFYALRDHRTPTRIALISVAVNVVANVILLQTPLREAGLALGTAISAIVNLTLLAVLLRKRLGGTILESMRVAAMPPTSERLAHPLSPSKVRTIPRSLLRSLGLAAVMGVGAYTVQAALYGAFGLEGRSSRLLSTLSAILAGAVLYAGLALLLRAREADEILALRKRRSS